MSLDDSVDLVEGSAQASIGMHSGRLLADERRGRIFRNAPTYTPASTVAAPATKDPEMLSPMRIAASGTVTPFRPRLGRNPRG